MRSRKKGDDKKGANALEYLMTYSWAVIIIMIVLGGLYTLGAFSGSNAPRLQPGGCVVLRPNGIGTTQFVSLSGTCSGELPEYVAQFNGQTGNILLPQVFPSTKACNATITAWFLDEGTPTTLGGIVGIYWDSPTYTNQPFDIEANDVDLRFEAHNTIVTTNEWYVPGGYKGSWYFAALVLSNGVLSSYINGEPSGTPPTTDIGCLDLDNDGLIGYWDGYFDGQIANVQIYSSGLSANAVSALYLEGIGGAPTRLTTLLGWWPLNGNTDDYSGNNYNGKLSGSVTYSSQWSTNYVPP